MAKRKFPGVQPRGKDSFRINYRDKDGERFYETIQCETAEEAADVRQQRLGKIAEGLPASSKPNTVLFEEIAADLVNHHRLNHYAAWKDLEARFRLHLLPIFGKKKAAQISTSQWKWYVLNRRDEGAAVATVNRELEAARAAYNLGKNATPQKILIVPKFPITSEKKFIRRGFFERDQLDAICRHLPKHLVPVAKFGYITGWRHSEVISRCWRHIHFDAGEVRLDSSKNEEARTFPMVPELRAVLESVRPKGSLFPGERVFTNNGEPIGRFDKAWRTACKKAGLPLKYKEKRVLIDREDPSKGKEIARYRRGKKKGQPILVARAAVYFHDFRRTAYRNLVRSGVPEKVAREAVGWKDAKTAERYNITARADLDIIRERYGANFGANRTGNSATN